jgi:LysR family transcriptional regulator, transcriptional activator of nhaA
MEWLNYHHLLYFWMVAREGSVVRASQQLRLAPSTISGQIQRLEDALGEQLFTQVGRTLRLTAIGQVVYGYADEIFTLGRDLLSTVRGQPTAHPLRVVVGITDVLPKELVYRLLQSALRLAIPVRLTCYEWEFAHMLAELALRRLDVIVADRPLDPGIQVRAFTHLLGSCGVSFCGTASLATTYGPGFPQSLDGAPLVLPTRNTSLRLLLDNWFAAQRLHPVVIAECEDSALLGICGQEGLGLFPVPSLLEAELASHLSVHVLGRVKGVRQRYYAITTEKHLTHPATAAIVQSARQVLAPRRRRRGHASAP